MRDDGGMILHRRLPLLGLVLAAIALGGCGSSSGSSTSSTAGSTAKGGVASAKQKCLDATKKIENTTARSVAEQACDQITTSDANVNTALSKAKQACLDAAASIPIDSVKQAADAQCKKIPGS